MFKNSVEISALSQPGGTKKVAGHKSLRTRINTDYPEVGVALVGHSWALPLLHRWDTEMPRDLEGSLRGGVIIRRVLDDLSQRHPQRSISHELKLGTTLGGTLSDVGRLDEDADRMREVYASGNRWRSNPDAPEWAYVQGHPGKSRDLISGHVEPDSPILQIPAYHHAVKVARPYSAPGVVPVEELPQEIQFGIQVAAAVDVIEAVTKKATGEGRAYVDPREFEGKSWEQVVTDEVRVDPEIAELAVVHTLDLKGLRRLAS